MNKIDKIFVAGHRGMVGSAICRKLQQEGYAQVITRTSKELDLTDQKAVNAFFEIEKPQFVFLAAAKVGGIHANNTYRADFLYRNLMIESNVIHASHVHGVQKLLFLGSSCIYPKMAPQPLKEESLLTGTLEYTNEPMLSPKLLVSNCAKPTATNTEETLFPPCPPTCMAPMTTMIYRIHTYFPR
jgi:GDP-L-fucose synthase